MNPGKYFTTRRRKNNGLQNYEVIVIGSGSGMLAVENAAEAGMKTALVDNGPAGGTCLNLGCIPSKILIAAADRVMEIREAERFSISAGIRNIDFKRIMADMKQAVVPDHQRIYQGLNSSSGFDFHEGLGRFTDEMTLEVNGKTLRGQTIFIASGARPRIPRIEGLEKTSYLTSETVLELDELPESLAIIGGGYIAAEYAHFFSAMGTRVTILQNNKRLVPAEEPEISDTLAEALSERMRIETGITVEKVEKNGAGARITFKRNQEEKQQSLEAEKLLVAAGRVSNADRLAPEKTGVETDKAGFIKTDQYLQTTRKGIWAIGDANGKAMFTHAANAEAEAAWANAMEDERRAFDYSRVPRAIFTWPPIASVGMKEDEARRSHEVLAGTAGYGQCAMGQAMRENRGFAKVILDRQNMNLLGFHIIGPHAPIVIQEVANAMAAGKRPGLVISGIHIHPALGELVMKAFSALK